jgi:hypothetical protein
LAPCKSAREQDISSKFGFNARIANLGDKKIKKVSGTFVQKNTKSQKPSSDNLNPDGQSFFFARLLL